MISIARPMIGPEEEAAVLAVLRSGQLAAGEQVELFERRFAEVCQVREAVAVANGTAALHLALLAHGIGPGDEVITSPLSFAATGNTILLVGAKPVFVDIEPDTYNIAPELVEAAITPRTKAIMPEHLYGNPADMRRLSAIAEAHGLVIIEDACQAHGATIDGCPMGSFGTGCFSFYATKNITTGEGGMVTTNDQRLAERMRVLCLHGISKDAWNRYSEKGSWYYEVLEPGFKYNLSDVQSAIGLEQLKKIERLHALRSAYAGVYTRRLGEIDE